MKRINKIIPSFLKGPTYLLFWINERNDSYTLTNPVLAALSFNKVIVMVFLYQR